MQLKRLLLEISEEESKILTDKIQNKEFKFFDKGDNGRIYSIDGEDKLFKITTETEEYKVADIIVGKNQMYTRRIICQMNSGQ